ncbi:pyrroloquinoline quinone biosynthesis peptide chaperone PqqD [Azomonas macrocytogenes]|uniref:PqqA binding protein n=1 Tax=Azomonas macrocytogenes TaxID=69962 RepID=A0A839T659_AZOMA|nr:pyrroloquinoline quinone biosynthesis peptide chaperone PqqD [Azomonas macrocytogenes]MBB3104539.1 pyrroloquinoline quinone biosynthesis protein D [Azomonas macrocytogenes]
MSAIADEQIPNLRRGFRFQWEPAQQAHVLLYPEGMIKLNEAAALILELVDGERHVAAIVDTLRTRFDNVPGIREDILEFLEVAHGNHWLEFR